MTSGTTGPIWLKRAGCPGRTTVLTGGGSSCFLASPLGGAACCGALQPLLFVADAAFGGVSRLCGGRRGPIALCCEPRQAIADARRRSKLDPRARVARELSRRTHKRGRGAPRDYSWRFRRSTAQGPPSRGRRGRDQSPPRLTRRTKNVQPTLLVARAAPGVRGGGPSARRLRALRPSRPPR